MDSLSREARALIEDARPAEGPSAEDRRRIKRAVMASVGAAALVGAKSAAAAGASASAGGIKLGGVLGKAITWGVIGGVAGVAVSMSAIPEPARAPIAPAMVARAAPIVHSSTERLRTAATERNEPDEAPAPVERSTPPTASVKSSTPRGQDPLLAEMTLIGRAQVAMREGRPQEALGLLRQHRERFGTGSMEEERAAAEVFSLCQLGRSAEARAGATRFLARFPSSPLAPRVRAACAETP